MNADRSDQLQTAPDHLYTWVDVDEHLSALGPKFWPDWLLEADAFWDSLELRVRNEPTPDTIVNWLETVFGANGVIREPPQIILDSGPAATVKGRSARLLPITITKQDRPEGHRRIPRFRQTRVLRDVIQALPRPQFAPFRGSISMAAFHSFKGGVGRTLVLLAVADRLASEGHEVLVIDGDLEAPGITWMYEAQGRPVDFALEDFVALVHESRNGATKDAVRLGAAYLQNQRIGKVAVLPATRRTDIPRPPRIQPIDLFTPERSQYVLTEALADLATTIGAEVALIDLRAGSSELSSPILLDPRVQRIFVTTLSGQSIVGSVRLAEEIGRLAPSKYGLDPSPIAVVTQFDPSLHEARLAEGAASIRDALAIYVPAPDGSEDPTPSDVDAVDQPVLIPFDSRLMATPTRWDDVMAVIRESGLDRLVQPIVLTLAPKPTKAPSTPAELGASESLPGARRALADLANGLVYAEKAPIHDFLVTEAITSLIESHRTEPPIAVAIGAKGSGKTFTFIQMCLRRTWSEFGNAAGISSVALKAPIIPVFASVNLPEALANDLAKSRIDSLKGGALHQLEARDAIKNLLARDNVSDVEWRRTWINALAVSAGLADDPPNAEALLAGFATNHQVIFTMDGLEDIFQDFSTSERQQQAIRALLIDVLDWLRTLRGKPLGLLVFIRQDLVQWAIRQNARQFAARYSEYALRWNAEEALRLVLWICLQAGALGLPDGVEVAQLKGRILVDQLIPVWGDKMGGPRSREARSDQWFLAALSDFNLQIQARDIVTFIAEAASSSIDDTRWPSRLLAPASMRAALLTCSREKIAAISDENPVVGSLLNSLRGLPFDQKRIPFEASSVPLKPEDLNLLEANGVVFREEDQYWIPEIFRHGLGFRAVGRPRILAVANLVRRRNNLD